MYTQLTAGSMVIVGSRWLSVVVGGRQLVARYGLRSGKPGARSNAQRRRRLRAGSFFLNVGIAEWQSLLEGLGIARLPEEAPRHDTLCC